MTTTQHEMSFNYRPLTTSEADTLKGRVWRILEHRQGQGNAIKAKAIATMLGYRDDRPIRAAIAELIADGCLIGASVDGRKGYFMIETEGELEMVRAVLRSRAVRIFERDMNLRQAWEREHGRELQPLLMERGE